MPTESEGDSPVALEHPCDDRGTGIIRYGGVVVLPTDDAVWYYQHPEATDDDWRAACRLAEKLYPHVDDVQFVDVNPDGTEIFVCERVGS